MGLRKAMVFNSKKWLEAGGDQPDKNEQFWELCDILEIYTKDSDLLAKIQWPDGMVSHGHIVSAMRDQSGRDMWEERL